MKFPALIASLATIAAPGFVPAPSHAVTPEQNPKCYRDITQATIYNKRYNSVPGFYCLESDGSTSYILDVSNYTKNHLAVTEANLPDNLTRFFIRFQDGTTKDFTMLWGLSTNTANEF